MVTFAGREGGLQLGRPAEEITLRDVVELIEGPLLLSECMLDEQACPFEGACPVRGCWTGLQKVMLAELVKTDFSTLAKEANIHQSILTTNT